MKTKIGYILFVLFTLFVVNNNIFAQKLKNISYVPTWFNWNSTDIDATQLTHLNLAFLHIKDGKVAFGEQTSTQTFEQSIQNIQQLRMQNSNLKVMVAVGGWGADGFSDMALNKKSREVFINSLVAFIEKYNFDGVDMDWEYPVNGGWGAIKARPEDKENFNLLLKETRIALDKLGKKNKKPYTLSFVVSVGGWFFDAVDIKEAIKHVDYIAVMAYDLSGAFSSQTEHNNPLYTSNNLWSIDNFMQKLLSLNVSRDKVILGIPLYGKIFEGVENKNNGLYQKFTKMALNAEGYVNFRDMPKYLNNKNFKKFYDSEAKVPYLYSAKDKIFITYVNEESIKELTNYITKHNLGGAMTWQILQDDTNFTLLKAINSGLNK